jgi:hypothetical protein
MIFTKNPPLSQTERILIAIRKSKQFGVPNYKLAQLSLKYSSRITELRQDGYNIVAIRKVLPNGRATNVFNYVLIEE